MSKWTDRLKAPFPYFGGKSRVAGVVWGAFGDVRNYVEPFAGSCAVLLARPTAPQTETINDLDGFVSNFWRAVKTDPEKTARFADWPVSEVDIIARHHRLIAERPMLERLREDDTWCDFRLAGWWVWGACAWIGAGWCRGESRQLPHLGAGRGINRKLPHLGAGMGINRKLPHLGDAGVGSARLAYIVGELTRLSERLRDVRVACGEWSRVLSPTVTWRFGAAAVFLDPPYPPSEHCVKYAAERQCWAEVCEYAIANGDNPAMRIALCGYEGTFDPPAGWTEHAWKTAGGYGTRSGRGRAMKNRHRERIWFSPACLQIAEGANE